MLGVDLVYIPEFERQLQTGGAAFVAKAFNPSELRQETPEHLAGVWAAKEAIVKASSKKIDRWTDVLIDYDAGGRPKGRLGSQQYNVSIAHHGEYAVAVAQAVQ